MKTRFTIDQVAKPDSEKYLNDMQMLYRIVGDRYNEMNGMTPVAERMFKLMSKLDKAMALGWKDIPDTIRSDKKGANV